MAVGGGVEPVDGVGGDAQGGVKTEGDVGEAHVVVDGLGQGDDVEPLLHELQGVLLRTATADADQAVEDGWRGSSHTITSVMSCTLPPKSMRWGLSRLVAENGAAAGEYTGEGVAVEPPEAVVHQAPEPVQETDHLHACNGPARLFSHAPDGRH